MLKKTLKDLIKPFEVMGLSTSVSIMLFWTICLFLVWFGSSNGTTNLFPTPVQVLNGFGRLWSGGLVDHLFSSLLLCGQAIIYSVIISLSLSYISVIPLTKNWGKFVMMLRYLPLTGITFYISIFLNDARDIQIWVLVMFMTTFLTTSLTSMINEISDEEKDHARTLGCSRWEVLWEVIIKGRFDYVFELVRQNLAIVWMMLVSIESILIAAGGLGVLIKNNDRMGDNGAVIAVQIIIILVGIGLDYGITALRRFLFKYSDY